MAPLWKLMCVFLFATLMCTSLSTSLSLQKIVGMIEAAKEGLSSQLTSNLKKAEDQMTSTLKKAEDQMTSNFQKMKKNVGDEFEDQMQNVTQQILVDILVDRNVLGQQMLEIRSCLSHPCENGGTCHATANTCMCLSGYGGAHCENCVTGFKKKGDTCIPDENIYKAMKPYQGSQYVIGTTTKNWQDARDACKKLNGDLAAADRQGEYSHIYDEKKRLDSGYQHWLGGTGQGKNGHWTWVSGVAITSSPKGSGYWYSVCPDESGFSCILSWAARSYVKTNSWDDRTCSARYKFICEY